MRKMSESVSNIDLGLTERTLSMLGGSWLLYNSLAREKKSILKAAAAGYLMYRGATGNCPLYGAVMVEDRDVTGRNIHIKTGLTVNRPQKEVWEFWRKLENLPQFMKHLESVTALDDNVSEWRAKIPGDMGTVTWRSEIVSEKEGDHIRWQSLPGSTIDNAGMINFRDAGKFGTEIQAEISYRAPLGTPGEGVLKLFNPVFKNMVRNDIRNFKRFMETGEVAVSGGQKLMEM